MPGFTSCAKRSSTFYRRRLLKHLSEVLLAIGPAGIMALAFLESAGIPLPGTDALLLLLAVESPRVPWGTGILAVIGSVAGNLVLFTAARRGGRGWMRKAEQPGRAQKYRQWFRRYGMVTVFVPAFIPIPMPLKLFVVSAGVTGTGRTTFLSVVLLARALRYAGLIALGVLLGKNSASFMKAHAWHFAGAAALLFLALYWLVRWRDQTRRALHSPEGFPPGAGESESSH